MRPRSSTWKTCLLPPLSVFEPRAVDADAPPGRREPRTDSPEQRSVRCGWRRGGLFFVLWTTFFSHLLSLAYNGLSLPWPDTIHDCGGGGGGGGGWSAVSCSSFSVRKMSAQTWKLQRSRRLFICGRRSRRVESVPARCASGISPRKLAQDAAVTPAGHGDASSAVTVA